MKNKYFLFLITLSTLCLLHIFSSCRQIDVFEKNTTIPKYEWQNNFAATGSFTIDDTLSSYNLYLVIRHTDLYAYNNVWLNVGLQSPGDTMYFQKIDLSLGNDATGWEGTGMNDIWEVRKLLNGQPRRFRKNGQYQFRIQNIMRDEPLKNIMSVGMRIEKIP